MLYQQAMEAGVEIPNLIDSKQLWTVNWSNAVNYAISLNSQLRISLPVLFQSERFDFTSQDTGEAYFPPAGMEAFFHEDRQIFGVGDAEVAGQYFHFTSSIVVGAEVGVRLPTGNVDADNYRFAEYRQGLGTGTFVPLARLMMFTRDPKRGWIGSLGAQAPLYANRAEYRTGYSVNMDAGYWLRWKKDYLSMVQLIGSHQTKDTWYGLDISQSNRSRIALSIMQTGPLKEDLEWIVGLQQPIWMMTWDQEEQESTQMTIVSFGLTWL